MDNKKAKVLEKKVDELTMSCLYIVITQRCLKRYQLSFV